MIVPNTLDLTNTSKRRTTRRVKSPFTSLLYCLLVLISVSAVTFLQPISAFITAPQKSHRLLPTCYNGLNGENVGDDLEDAFKQLKIAFVTGNKMKVRELNMILAEHGATKGPDPDTSLVDLRILNVDLPEIQEVNTEAIAKHKGIQGAQLAGGPCVVEDSALQFNALGGMPGPYIKWFQQKLQSDGLYNLLQAYEDKSAVAICTLAFCPYPHADPVLFTGRTEGTIVEPVEGRGFGWDSIFLPDGSDVPFSCMTTEEKNSFSHRGKAVRKWADWLGLNQQELWERQSGRPAIGHKGLDFKSLYSSE